MPYTCKSQDVALYGAQMVAVRVYFALKRLYPSVNVLTFLVSDRKGNPSEIDGVPVIELGEFHRKDTMILIAAPDVHHPVIAAELQKRSFLHYRYIDSRTEAKLLERFYRREGRFLTLPSCQANGGKVQPLDPSGAAVYMAKFYKDKTLKSAASLPLWIRPIQAGAALTEERVASVCDNEGEHISHKNPNYSELTASYWIGKHGEARYLGLYHYRRILDVGDEDWDKIYTNDIDVILPYPSIQYPDANAHHRRYLREEDWEAMLRALKELEPSYAKALPEIFFQRYFYNFNILIAKNEIYKQYCDWLFPVLARTEELSTPKGSERRDRYIGYLGESLTTLFFLFHEKDFRIAHTGCLMLT